MEYETAADSRRSRDYEGTEVAKRQQLKARLEANMRHHVFHHLMATVVVLAVPAISEATPFLPEHIYVGAAVEGSFSFPVATSPPDADPSVVVGRYVVGDSTAHIVTQVGGTVFSSTAGGLAVQVVDQTFDADWIQLFGTGNESTFSPFLSGFLRQSPSTDPYGVVGLNFRFSPDQLASDAFPTSIDPLATVPHRSAPRTGIKGGVEGISTRRRSGGTREWAFFYDVDPSTFSMMVSAGLLTGTFLGTIVEVDDRALVVVPEPIPEPSSFLLLLTGLVALRKYVTSRN